MNLTGTPSSVESEPDSVLQVSLERRRYAERHGVGGVHAFAGLEPLIEVDSRRMSLESFHFQFVATPPNHALQRTRPSRRGFKRHLQWAGSLSLGR